MNEAYPLGYKHARERWLEGKDWATGLKSEENIKKYITAEEIDACFDPHKVLETCRYNHGSLWPIIVGYFPYVYRKTRVGVWTNPMAHALECWLYLPVFLILGGYMGNVSYNTDHLFFHCINDFGQGSLTGTYTVFIANFGLELLSIIYHFL